MKRKIEDRLWDLFFLSVGIGIVAVIWLFVSMFVILFSE